MELNLRSHLNTCRGIFTITQWSHNFLLTTRIVKKYVWVFSSPKTSKTQFSEYVSGQNEILRPLIDGRPILYKEVVLQFYADHQIVRPDCLAILHLLSQIIAKK